MATDFAVKETEERFCQCPLFAEVNMSLSSWGPCCSWHLSPPQLCSRWRTPFRSQRRQKQGNPGSPGGRSASPRKCQDLPGRLPSQCQALCAVSTGSWKKLGGKRSAWMGKLMCFCFQTSEPFTLRWGPSLKVQGTALLPIEMFLGGKERPHVAILGFSSRGPFAAWKLKLSAGEIKV